MTLNSSIAKALVAIAATTCSAKVLAVEPGPIDRGAPMAFTKTDTGLEYRILRKSDGVKPKATDKVTVHYRGWLDDESEFDSTYKRGNTATFPLKFLIKGWIEGLQLIGEGGMIELNIPPELGYGEAGAGDSIPPNARLHFLVELKKVRKSDPP